MHSLIADSERGAAAVEYSLLVALVADGVMDVVLALGQSVLALFQTVVPGF